MRYSDDIELEKGADLSPSDETCTIGKEQSPINLKKDRHLLKNDLSFSYGSIPLNLKDNKHTIKVIAEGENFVTFDGESISFYSSTITPQVNIRSTKKVSLWEFIWYTKVTKAITL